MRGLFVTGSGTGVGKTHVTSSLARQLVAAGKSVGVYKPVCSGGRWNNGRLTWHDVEELSAAAGIDDRERVCPQRFAAALAPPDAARAEGRVVDAKLLRSGVNQWSSADVVLVEGAGGFLSPISETDTVADLASDLGLPLLLVVACRLGGINDTLLNLEAMERRQMDVVGIVLNQVDANVPPKARIATRRGIEQFAKVPIIGEWPHEAGTVRLPVEQPSPRIDVGRLFSF